MLSPCPACGLPVAISFTFVGNGVLDFWLGPVGWVGELIADCSKIPLRPDTDNQNSTFALPPADIEWNLASHSPVPASVEL